MLTNNKTRSLFWFPYLVVGLDDKSLFNLIYSSKLDTLESFNNAYLAHRGYDFGIHKNQILLLYNYTPNVSLLLKKLKTDFSDFVNHYFNEDMTKVVIVWSVNSKILSKYLDGKFSEMFSSSSLRKFHLYFLNEYKNEWTEKDRKQPITLATHRESLHILLRTTEYQNKLASDLGVSSRVYDDREFTSPPVDENSVIEDDEILTLF